MRKLLVTIFFWGLVVMEAEGEAQGQGHLMLADSLKTVKPATYGIAIQRSKLEGVETTYVGTGFFVSDKYLVTAAHVIKNSKRPLQPQDIILIYQPEPPGASFKLIGPLTIVHLSEEVDLAILQSPVSSLAPVQMDFGAVPGWRIGSGIWNPSRC